MTAPSLRPYENPRDHEAVAQIIRRHSVNQADIRKIALQGLDLSFAREILELGCGFGFMSEAVAARLDSGAHLTGVDACAANEEPFVQRVAACGISASFDCRLIGSRLPWPDRSFDMVICSYSLYFFADALPEVARILSPDGLLLTVTHSEHCCTQLLKAAGIENAEAVLARLIRPFSAESGGALLEPRFDVVERIDYSNHLRFAPQHLEELLTYLRLKLHLLTPETQADCGIPEPMLRSVNAWLAQRGEIIVEKDDACFRCWRPLCH